MSTTIYKDIRKAKGISREKAAEGIGISVDKLEKIENGKQNPNSYDILYMIEYYKSPMLRNYFCTHHCALGEPYKNQISSGNLPEIAVKLFNSINNSYDLENALIKISDDGKIHDDEIEALVLLQRDFTKLRDIIETFNVYIEEKILNGEINKEKYLEEKNNLLDK